MSQQLVGSQGPAAEEDFSLPSQCSGQENWGHPHFSDSKTKAGEKGEPLLRSDGEQGQRQDQAGAKTLLISPLPTLGTRIRLNSHDVGRHPWRSFEQDESPETRVREPFWGRAQDRRDRHLQEPSAPLP